MTLGGASAARAEEEPWLQSWQSIAKDLIDVASPAEREFFEFIDDVVPESEDYFAFLRPHVALDTVAIPRWVAAFAAFDQLDDALTMQFVRDAAHSGDKRATEYLARRLMPMQIRRERFMSTLRAEGQARQDYVTRRPQLPRPRDATPYPVAVEKAARAGDVKSIVAWLFWTRGSHVDSPSEGLGHTLLMVASSRGHARLVSALLRRGACPNRLAEGADGIDVTALHVAASKGRHEIAQLLLAAQADPAVRTSHPIPMTALDIAKFTATDGARRGRAAAEGAAKIVELLARAEAQSEGSERGALLSGLLEEGDAEWEAWIRKVQGEGEGEEEAGEERIEAAEEEAAAEEVVPRVQSVEELSEDEREEVAKAFEARFAVEFAEELAAPPHFLPTVPIPPGDTLEARYERYRRALQEQVGPNTRDESTGFNMYFVKLAPEDIQRQYFDFVETHIAEGQLPPSRRFY